MLTWKCLFCEPVEGPGRDVEIAAAVGIAINQWICQKGNTIVDYTSLIDREFDIADLVVATIIEVDKQQGL